VKSYWDYLAVMWLVACVLIAFLLAALTPLSLIVWAIVAGVWPLAIPAALLYIPVFAGIAMFFDRLDGK
jgi:hypothetical protein